MAYCMDEFSKKESEPFFNLFGIEQYSQHGNFRIKKSNGRQEPFYLRKLSNSISNAFKSIGEEDTDTAYSLAVAIKTYLREVYGADSLVSTKQVFDATSQILEEMGYDKVARAYREYDRLKKLRVLLTNKRVLELNKRYKEEEDVISGEDNLFLIEWKFIHEIYETLEDICRKGKINLSDGEKHKIVDKVKTALASIGSVRIRPSHGFVRELCVLALSAEGYEIKNLEELLLISIDLKDVLNIISRVDKESGITPSSTSTRIGEVVKGRVGKEYIYSRDVMRAIEDGKIYLMSGAQVDKLDSVSLPVYSLWSIVRESKQSIVSVDDFLKNLLEVSEFLCDFFSGYVEWWGLNIFSTPLLSGFEGNEYKEWLVRANKNLREFKTNKPNVHFTLDWDTFESISDLPVFGSSGKCLRTEYTKYISTARENFLDFLEIYCNEAVTVDFPNYFVWRIDPRTSYSSMNKFWDVVSYVVKDKQIPLGFRILPISEADINPGISLNKVVIDVWRLWVESNSEQELFSNFYNTLLLSFKACEEYISFLNRCKELFGETKWERLFSFFTSGKNNKVIFEAFPFTISLSGLKKSAVFLLGEKKVGTLEIIKQMRYMMGKFRRFVDSLCKYKKIRIKLAYETECDLANRMGFAEKYLSSQERTSFGGYLFDSRIENPQILSIKFREFGELGVYFNEFLDLTRYFDAPVRVILNPSKQFSSAMLQNMMGYIFSASKEFLLSGNSVSFEILLLPHN